MNEQEYILKHYPKDFILIGLDFYPLPIGGSFSIEQKEISSVLTTANGTKRKDTIRKYEAASIKFNTMFEDDLNYIKTIIEAIENSDYEVLKYLFIKKQNMPASATSFVRSDFKQIKIELVSTIKINYSFRKNNMFIYTGVNLKIN
ncbi:hypothetical protein [Treponema phagedenis]|uniref:Uncharacterized protein n=1 Tax=Treponema phagedenis TaxID=162 RepID=A0AAE6M734_TREPH|nr:hypothetical protein [Treponema phagedenis]QEJ96673.1 hypothetical protein FUT82_00720 [Treponema phagedenis]QEJ97004.1 hypothetical protein FUT82_02725 [Treponema phagedenis]QEJ97088.1 hypothetical protein FUT82_03205 [Treponema phagedenis]QEK02914.1 hypothetical protein FUT83_03205 [Treponema phagedenis]QEK08542.1 hypothetical protein FUT81_03195 [Treponema phagedenis]